jgi:hypothetical protein
MASFKWKKVPIFESSKVAFLGEERKVLKYEKVNRLSNYQIIKYLDDSDYKKLPIAYQQLQQIAERRKLINV